MDTPIEEQQPFLYVSRNIVASEKEITEPSMLSMDSIKSVSIQSKICLITRTSQFNREVSSFMYLTI